MHVTPWQLLPYPFLLCLGLLLPGHLLMRALGLRTGLLEAFLGSSALLFNLVLLLQVSGLGLARGTLLASTALLCLALFLASRRRDRPGGCWGDLDGLFDKGSRLWLLPALAGLGAIAFRAIVDPLSGYDQAFRWDQLARLILERGNLDFYPPVSAADYAIYGWCDAIPPLTSLLNLWCYVSLGAANPLATAPRILLEGVLVMVAARRLALQLSSGGSAGNAAMAAAASSALLLWTVANGQETALIAISLCAMIVFLLEAEDDASLLKAGLAAAVAAACREYGLGACLLGIAAVLLQRRSLRASSLFLLATVTVGAGWYLRNWALTGNPLWPHPLFGLFASHPLHREIMRDTAEIYSPLSNPAATLDMLVQLAAAAGLLLALALAGTFRRGTRHLIVVLLFACTAAFWWPNLSMSLGGWGYSKRVLAPALVLAAALAGTWLGRRSAKAGLACVLLLTLASLDAGLRSFQLPVNALASPAQLLSLDWKRVRDEQKEAYANPVWDRIAKAAEGRGIASDDVDILALLVNRRVEANAIMSPRLRFLFDETQSFEKQDAQLKSLGLRFLILQEPNPLVDRNASRHHFFKEFTRRFTPNARFCNVRVYDLDKLQAVPASP
jgi:hypothetical protein